MNALQPDNPYYWHWHMQEPVTIGSHYTIMITANDEILEFVAQQPENASQPIDLGVTADYRVLPTLDVTEVWCKWYDLITAFVTERQRESVWSAAINELDGLV